MEMSFLSVLGKFLSPEEMSSIEHLIGELLSSKASKLDWSYPLSEILDQYNRKLLEEQCNLNYSETALVIQNSTNVYERRVDRLHQDTSDQRNSLNEHDAQNEKIKATTPRQRNVRNKLDLDNIERVNFLKDVSRNCLLKSKKSSKKIKLLSQRYPQLENMCRHKFSMNILDTHGENIGKKYDYRCNQQLSSTHMLVDELSPEDVQKLSEQLEKTQETSPSLFPALDLPTSKEIPSPGCSRTFPAPSHCQYEHQYTSDLDADDFCDADPGNESQESGYATMTDLSSTTENLMQDLSQNISSLALEGQTRKDATSSLISCSLLDVSGHITPPEEIQGSVEDNLHAMPSKTVNLNKLSPTTNNSDESIATTPKTEDSRTTENVQSVAESADKSCDSSFSSPLRKRIRESVETDAGYTSGDAQELPSSPEPARRSKRLRSSVINELNSEGYRAIPFEAPIPEKNSKPRVEFKLPCHISLLRSSTIKKRKVNGELRRKRKLTRYLTEEKNKMLLYSPSQPYYRVSRFAEEEAQRIIEERLFKERLNCGLSEFDAILGENEDLRGFSKRFADFSICERTFEEASASRTEGNEKQQEKEQETEHGSQKVQEYRREGENTSITSGVIDNRLQHLQETSCSYTPPHSPEFSGSFEPGGSSGYKEHEEDHCEPSTSVLSHQEKIEKRMKELQNEFDVRTERVDETARWIRAMEALRMVERRPEFNVKDYERRIVRNLVHEPERKLQFEEIAMAEEPEDISRLFVASLHLANTYTVDISSCKETSSITLSLLKDSH